MTTFPHVSDESFCFSDNFIISTFAVSGPHNSLQLYCISQNPTHLNAQSIVTIHNQAIFDTACFTQGSVVGITTGFGLDGPGIESRWGRDFPHLSRLALGPTRPPVQ